MPKIVVLGAGAMGSALCTPLVAAGWETRLWGTWLDDHLLDACEQGLPHPRTNVPLAKGTLLYRSGQLEEALDGVDAVFLSVASQGVPKVTELALQGISQAKVLLVTSKGFCPDDQGRIELLPQAIRRIAAEHNATLPPIVGVAGPCKANEVAEGKPTATIYGSLDRSVAEDMARRISTDVYCIEPTGDEVGVEVCAPMKNVYAISLGVADGLEEATGFPHHNLKAATFAQAVREMSLLSTVLGADPVTAFGLAGVGDLEVTGLSGRNKVYGLRIGRGEPAVDALDAMVAAEQTVEGVPAAGLAKTLVEQLGDGLPAKLPLLQAVLRVISGEQPPLDIISAAVMPPKLA
ncbi:NAD(P)H-dependent glycerol-3-phosphate dehydrogenase [Propionicicella superfundia]|uniref:NAD(P)H-dependent glycerol-3-phosphate dehydrogenase n=1 Tax=Propionicicella superfundia TaxID=348582 RepID=UPI0003FED252|nr:NAD(P)-binding domain-containing protein [Propionicicella superfundia]